MTFGGLLRAWDRFLFEPVSPVPMAVYRILLGGLVVVSTLLVLPDAHVFFGADGVAPRGAAALDARLPGWSVLAWLPNDPAWLYGFFTALLAAALCLTAGFCTRLSSAIVFIGLVSLHRRNHIILTGGDNFMRLAAFYLIFSPAGRALSVDRWLRVRRGLEPRDRPPAPAAPWAQRLIQIQLAVAYFVTAWWKLGGHAWINGTAVYYVTRLDEFRRFPVPYLFESIWFAKLATWGTLVVEFALATLVWFRDLRYPVLLAGVALHLGLEYALNIPMFQWVMLSAYVLFVEPADVHRAMNWAKRRTGLRRAGKGEGTPAPHHAGS